MTTSNPEPAQAGENTDQTAATHKGLAGRFLDVLGLGSWQGLITAVLLALALREFLFAAYKIPSGSMIPTLEIGDQLIVNKITYGLKLPLAQHKLWNGALPEHGDIMVFRFPQDPSIDFIKRVIGVPGDAIRIDGRSIWVNDVALKREPLEDLVYQQDDGSYRTATRFRETHGDHSYEILFEQNFFPSDHTEFTVPEGSYFMMGDNRDRSNDSRRWGFVPQDYFVGSPLVMHFSWDSLNWKIRFGRMFRTVE